LVVAIGAGGGDYAFAGHRVTVQCFNVLAMPARIEAWLAWGVVVSSFGGAACSTDPREPGVHPELFGKGQCVRACGGSACRAKTA
jgi:hypothetical protein